MLSTVTASLVLAVLATAGLSAAGETQLANVELAFINIKTINSDGTASATAQYNECPIALPATNGTNHVVPQDGSQSTQQYTVAAYGSQCTMKGGATGSTMTCVNAAGTDDGIQRVFSDMKYTPYFCPPQCSQECAKVDPSWGPATAQTMFAYSWYQDPSTFHAPTKRALRYFGRH